MGKPKKKKSKAPQVDWTSILISGAIDFLVGFLLLVLDKIMK